ncbi:transcriptional regulator, PadR family [Bacillus sp. JCM 19046]|uniref:PadR family transcriptional regulator PadR n=1 Tax=Shouchella xiaoxiensis TaxID=766895 RepID=A0ABS2T0Q2_9BACI|nr:PadR family transcriptional regulator [Shouchella xiaoxiensis]MBM7840057.1 PadR family transcriptional regulator PadR [Shouchella xiaoxiensis]GAF12580.1 transcriptional regulator, PadR family [Bacillus sp. JCM 19045]GAF18184.1 transcriptional regulator, PadR family [Bacillus sp. JCM 19046]
MDSIVLSLLIEDDRYGYDISKEISLRTEGKFEVKEGTLYAVFQRLEKKAYISSYYGEHSHGGKRKYYTITGNGKSYLRSLSAEWKELKQVVDLFMKE